ncbi:MAG: RcnB family protein [Pseudomonadota bacterium]
MKQLLLATIAMALVVGPTAALADPPNWDDHSNNGYYTGHTWHYGTPSAATQRRHDYRADFRPWRQGQRLPPSWRGRYQEVDWRSEHLHAPRHGYHYVRDDTGNILLVAVATGLIASIIAHH